MTPTPPKTSDTSVLALWNQVNGVAGAPAMAGSLGSTGSSVIGPGNNDFVHITLGLTIRDPGRPGIRLERTGQVGYEQWIDSNDNLLHFGDGFVIFESGIAVKGYAGRPWIDVTAFSGVDPTGVSDSTAGLQAAINTIPASGAILQFPAGLYSISSILFIPANTTVRGAGMDVTIIRARGGFASTAMLSSTGDNLAFEGLTLDGRTPWEPPAISALSGSGLPTGNYTVAYAWVGADGTSAQSGRSSQSNAVQTSLTLTSGNSNIYVNPLTGLPSYVTAVNFYLVDVPGGVTNGFVSQQMVSGGATPAFIIFTQGNGALPQTGPAGINATGGTGLSVFNLKTIRTGGSGVVHSNRTLCRVVNSHFEQSLQYAIEACCSPATRGLDYRAIGNTIIKCDHPQTAPGGILYCRVDNYRVVGNSADTVHGAFVAEGCTKGTITGNVARNVRDSGVRVSCMDSPVAGDWPYDHYASVTGNTVTCGALSTAHGIIIRGNRCTVAGNVVQGAAQNGIDMVIGPPPNVSSSTTGPYFENHHNSVTGNAIQDCRDGIHIENFGVQIPTFAPTVSAASGGSLAAGTYTVVYTYSTAAGESAQGPANSVILTANQQVSVAQITGIDYSVTALNFYFTATPGTTGYVASRTPSGGTVAAFTINQQGNGSTGGPPVRSYVEDLTIAGNSISGCSNGLWVGGDTRNNYSGLFDKWVVIGNNLIDNTAPYAAGDVDVMKLRNTCRFRDNLGPGPVGVITAPSVPASGSASTTVGCDCTAYITAGSIQGITAVRIGSTVITGVTVLPGTTSAGIRVPAGLSLTLTYGAGGTAPSWQWFADNI